MKNKLTISIIALLFFAFTYLQLNAQVTGQIPIDPRAIPQFVDPVPHFAGLRVDATGGDLIVKYVPGEQIAVSTGTLLTTGTVGIDPGAGLAKVWAYTLSNDNGATYTPPLWPAFTIETHTGFPLNVLYKNELYGETYENVNLVVDQTLHWADPLGDHGAMTPYLGEIPVVPHLHGGEVPSESDGGPDAWFTPDYSILGPSWGIDGTDQHYYYPNDQEAATLWYHDHSLGVTRLNVYAGLAGFYFLRGDDEEISQLPGWSGDDLVREVAPVGASGVFNPEPYLPEIELVFQDRMFDQTGGLYYPNLPANPLIHPFWTPEFIGDVMTVNGKTWPYLSVAPRKYRFRLLNGSNARFYELFLIDMASNNMGPAIVQVGTDGGLMDSPVPINGKLVLAPGERADIVIDFSGSTPNQVWTLKNTANTPYPKGGPPNGKTMGRVMQFVVNGEMVSAADQTQAGIDKSMLPASLRTNNLVKLTDFAGTNNVVPDVVRQLTLNEVMAAGGPLEALVNNSKWDLNGMGVPGLGETELPVEGNTELWQIINLTGDAHPIHLHLVQFQVVSRQKYNVNKYSKAYANAFGGVVIDAVGPPMPADQLNADGALGGNPAITPYLQGPVRPAELNEQGWKDTYIVYPGEVSTFITRFAPTDIALNAPPTDLLFSFNPSEGPGYVWHCHILDHEDNEMMRPYKVIASAARDAALKGTEFADNSGLNDLVGVELGQNYPNPFQYETSIPFSLPAKMHVTITLYDQLGRMVETLVDNEAPAGRNTIRLDASNLPAGAYYYRLTAGDFVGVKKLVLIK